MAGLRWRLGEVAGELRRVDGRCAGWRSASEALAAPSWRSRGGRSSWAPGGSSRGALLLGGGGGGDWLAALGQLLGNGG